MNKNISNSNSSPLPTGEGQGVRLEAIRSVYFVGAGGIGMSALIRYFLSKGKTVGGLRPYVERTDRTSDYGRSTDTLRRGYQPYSGGVQRQGKHARGLYPRRAARACRTDLFP